MAAGKRYKFQGSTIEVMTGFVGGSPLLSITGITNADPAVVHVTAHGRATGDVVKITEVVGMDEVNDDIFIVEVVDADHFSLVDVNATGYGTYTSGGKIDPATFSNFCELTNYNRQGGTSPELDATTLCSIAKEYELGLPDFGTTALSFNFAPTTTVQGALHDFFLSGDKLAIRVTLPKNGGELVQLGFVQQESETVGVGGLWTAQATIKNTGNRFDL
jgi:Ubiquitin-activating enzyme E1 FCCH domain